MFDQTFNLTLQNVVGIIAQRVRLGKPVSGGELDAAAPSLSEWIDQTLNEFTLRYNPPRDPMSLLTFNQIGVAFGIQDVLHGVSAVVPHQARIALVGPNGIGKTTLLRILVGLERPDHGRVHRARGLTIGYLPQEMVFSKLREADLQRSLRTFCLSVYSDLRAKEAELTRLEGEMGNPRTAEEALVRYGELQDSFERLGGYEYQHRIDRVLRGLGFQESEFDRKLVTFSGGERTRAELARLLLQDPDLLVLDEPTNHLDIETIEWLEGWLRDWPGALLAVSHDRYLMDKIAENIWELSPTGLTIYRGNYSSFLTQRVEARESHAARFKRQEAMIEKERDYIHRNIAGQNTRQAQGRRTRLDRFLQDEALAKLEIQKNITFKFETPERAGDRVLITKGLIIKQPESQHPLFEVPDLLLQRGECAAIIGPNGAGKTTLLKALVSENKEFEGEIQLGAGVQVGYFAQAHEGLNPAQTPFDTIRAIKPDLSDREVRTLLGSYLFQGDDVFKRIGDLSGGERGRIGLASLVLQGSNLLLLDEPTNHLDIPSQEILQQALAQFPGTILLVSHDRYLIQALATQIWSIHPEEKKLVAFQGSYAEFIVATQETTEGPAVADTKTLRKERSRRTGPSKHEIESVELKISELETELAALTVAMEALGADFERLGDLGKKYRAVQTELEMQLKEWERLGKAISEA